MSAKGRRAVTSATRRAVRRVEKAREVKPVPATTLSPLVTIDRAELAEKVEWLEIDHFLVKLGAIVNEMVADAEAGLEREKNGAECSQRWRDFALRCIAGHEHEAGKQIRLIYESVNNAQEAIRELMGAS